MIAPWAALGFLLLPLPAPQRPVEKPPYPVVRLEAAGPYLLVLRKGVGYPYSYTLLDTGAKQPLWEARDECCGGPPPWEVLLSPAGTGAVVLYPGGTPYRLIVPGKAPVPLRPFHGGAWAGDGSWFGGAQGAFSAEGRLLRPGVPEPGSAPNVLFAAGPGPALLRYVDLKRGVRMTWDGTAEPRPDGPFRCARLATERNLDGPSVAPVRFSPEGRHVAWLTRGGDLKVCDGTGKEVAVPGEASSYAWAGESELLFVSEGRLRRLVLPGGASEPLPLPRGVVPSAVATTPTWIYIGTEKGEVYRAKR